MYIANVPNRKPAESIAILVPRLSPAKKNARQEIINMTMQTAITYTFKLYFFITLLYQKKQPWIRTNFGLQNIAKMASWGTGIRTPITAAKGRCPAVRRSPNLILDSSLYLQSKQQSYDLKLNLPLL